MQSNPTAYALAAKSIEGLAAKGIPLVRKGDFDPRRVAAIVRAVARRYQLRLDDGPRHARHVAVVNERGEEFDCYADAAKSVGLSADSIAKAVARRTKAGGMLWWKQDDPAKFGAPPAKHWGRLPRRVRDVETGEEWPDAHAAAAALRRNVGTLFTGVSEGRRIAGRKLAWVEHAENGQRAA